MNVISPMSDLTKVPTATLQAKSNNLRPMASDPDSKITAKEARAEADRKSVV